MLKRLPIGKQDFPSLIEGGFLYVDKTQLIPYQITGNKEAYFHSILHVVLSLTGYLVFSEVPTNKGRMDSVLDIGQSIYIFECKLQDSEQTALQQIKNNDYAKRFQQSGKRIVLVGIAFSAIDKNIKNWVSEVV
jgi:hypothetical protein